MGALVSSEMLEARKLVTKKGYTPTQAAEAVGLTKQAIYMSQWYKDHRDAKARKGKK